MKLRHSLPLALLLTAFSFSGCIERKQAGVVNPDGSGKAMIDTLMETPATAPGSAKPDASAMAHQLATSFIAQAQGVDAWKDIVIDTAKDGRAHFSATAYFPDINKVKMDAVMPLSWIKRADGVYTLEMQNTNPPAAIQGASKLTEEQITAQVAKAKADYKQNQAMAQMILGPLKIEISYTLPGKITGTNIFTQNGDNGVTLVIEGKKLLAAMDKIMSDDQGLAAQLRAGKNLNDNEDQVIETMYGKKGPVMATVSGPVAPLFDYKTEMAAAKAAQADAFKSAGIDPSKPQLPGGMVPPPVVQK